MEQKRAFDEIDVRLGEPTEGTPEEDTPFRLLLLGDFGGPRAHRKPLAARKPVRVDRDSFEDVLARLDVELPLDAGGAPVAWRVRELDDLHPDRLLSRVDRLRDLADAAERAAGAPPPRHAALLDNILEGRSEAEEPPRSASDDLGTLLRSLLHEPSFRAVEAAWRGVDFLLRRLDTDGPLTIHLLDLSREELEVDLLDAEDVAQSALHRILVEETVGTPGGVPWAAAASLFDFDGTLKDAVLLGRLAGLGSAVKTPILAGAAPSLLGCASLEGSTDPGTWSGPKSAGARDAWDALRRLPAARYVGLALPRLLLRVPYGKAAEPLEKVPFEELSTPPEHEEFLWGSAALGAALLLGQAFEVDGWSLRPGSVQEIPDLPFAVYEEDGEKVAKSCAEVLFTVKAAQALGDRGLMPLLWHKGTDLVRLGIFQSIAEPAAPLAGRWPAAGPPGD